MRLTVAEAHAHRIRERNGTIEVTGPWWALTDTNAREVIYFFNDLSEARDRLGGYADAGCVGCTLKREATLSEALGWHEPFTGEDEIERREHGQDAAEFEWETA